jgi:hypothetical protein
MFHGFVANTMSNTAFYWRQSRSGRGRLPSAATYGDRGGGEATPRPVPDVDSPTPLIGCLGRDGKTGSSISQVDSEARRLKIAPKKRTGPSAPPTVLTEPRVGGLSLGLAPLEPRKRFALPWRPTGTLSQRETRPAPRS